MPIKDFPILNHYDKQRFIQFGSMDVANWYLVDAPTGKKGKALYPTMGRQPITVFEDIFLEFPSPILQVFKSIDYLYVVIESGIYRVTSNFQSSLVTTDEFPDSAGNLNFDYLPVAQDADNLVYVGVCTGNSLWIYDESSGGSFVLVTDPNGPENPNCIASFGNRFAVSENNSTLFFLTRINLGASFNPDNVFTDPKLNTSVFAQESGIIRQMGVLHNNLYIFTDYTTGVWSNTQSTITTFAATTTFPWKKNTSYDFDFGIADPHSLDIDFGMMVWLGQNRNGLVEFMSSNGQSQTPITTQAINVVLQNISNSDNSGYLATNTVGFLYQYEDTRFYRANIGVYTGDKFLDQESQSYCLEYNFETQTWHRCIEANGERNRIQYHEFFNNIHCVSVLNEVHLFQMSGEFYNNYVFENLPALPAYTPFRYENITPIIFEKDYAEFKTNWIQIDFVWGMGASYSDSAFPGTQFIIKEGTEDDPTYITAQDGQTFLAVSGTNVPTIDSTTFNALYNPNITLYYSDDGGISFHSMDNLFPSDLGVYSWRMRWYQGGCSRNRVYKLICVSIYPIVILGGIHHIDIVSGGAD